MPIKWSALKVAQSLDEMANLLYEAEPILMECCQKATETAKLPNLAGYISEPLVNFAYDIKDRLERYHQRSLAKSFSGIYPFIVPIQMRFDQWLELCDGDEQKAQQAMSGL